MAAVNSLTQRLIRYPASFYLLLLYVNAQLLVHVTIYLVCYLEMFGYLNLYILQHGRADTFIICLSKRTDLLLSCLLIMIYNIGKELNGIAHFLL